MTNHSTLDQTSTRSRAFDTRCKLVLVTAASIALFCFSSWAQLGLFMAGLLLTGFVSGISWRRALLYCLPLSPFIVLSLLGNAFNLSWSGVPSVAVPINTITAPFPSEPVHIVGMLYLIPQGFAQGLFAALRILLLLGASIVFALTTSGNEIMSAAFALGKPLRKLKVPLDDLICIFAIALRFIPLIGVDAQRIYRAQKARAAKFDEGRFVSRLKAWSWVLIPLFMSLFRHAETLAEALDARAYGSCPERGSLGEHTLSAQDFALSLVVLIGLVLLVLLPQFMG